MAYRDPPPLTYPASLADLRAAGVRPFALRSYDAGGYLEIPTVWARDAPTAIRQFAHERDAAARVTDRHGRQPSRATRDFLIRWSVPIDTGLLRAEPQPWPAPPDAGRALLTC